MEGQEFFLAGRPGKADPGSPFGRRPFVIIPPSQYFGILWRQVDCPRSQTFFGNVLPCILGIAYDAGAG
jgi:hypothetical protein